MKVADNLHQNQRSLNILSFEKALGYHLERHAEIVSLSGNEFLSV